MGLLDLKFKLPKISSTSLNSITSSVSTSVSFAVSNATTKISEAASATIGSFGDALGPFTKLGANMPTFAALGAAAQRAGNILIDGSDALVKSFVGNQLDAVQGQATASSVKNQTQAGQGADRGLHKVTLAEGENIVDFDVMPEIVEAHTVQYEAVAPAQFPGAFQKYKGSDSTQWTLNITLISRTPAEADANYKRINTLRGWKKPFFGQTTGNSFPRQLGAPPPVLMLKGLRDLIGPVPVVITSLNWNWPKDVDYLPTLRKGPDQNYIPFPAVMNLAIQMVESYSTSQFNQFDLSAYREGKMVEAFNGENGRNVTSASGDY